MKLSIVISVFCVALALADTAGAKMYKYYDESGNLCVTDDLSQVPESIRSSAETLEAVQPAQSAPQPVSNTQISGSTRPQDTDWKRESDLKEEFIRLERIRKDLEAQYTVLKQRRDDLVLEQKEEKSPEQLEAFNQNVSKLNRDTIEYKKRKEGYMKQVEAYNKRLEFK